MQNSAKSNQKVLLAVLAHPDDETFGMGGTLAFYARRGVAVHLVCATRGEVGEMDPRLLRGFNSIGERREAELRCAAEKLGLAAVHFLDYRDSGMPGSPDNSHPQALAAQPVDEVAVRVSHYIRLLQPQVVVTFDPIGGYRHPDHIAIHNATVKAFEWSADEAYFDPQGLPAYRPQKLYYHVIPHGWLRLLVKVMPFFGRNPRQFGINKDIDLVSIAEVEFPTHASINYKPVVQERAEATECHESQGGSSLSGGIGGFVRRLFGARDTFMRAIPPAEKGVQERDLFDNVR